MFFSQWLRIGMRNILYRGFGDKPYDALKSLNSGVRYNPRTKVLVRKHLENNRRILKEQGIL